jgi:hypothetical protein
MDSTLQKYFEELKQYSDLSNPDNDMPFADIIDKIVSTGNADAVPLLLKFVDDNTNCEYTYESWSTWIESFDAEKYIPALLIELKDVFLRAPDHCEYFFYTIFNTTGYLEYLKLNIYLADKETMLILLDNIGNDKGCLKEHKPIIKELRELVNK